MSQQPDDVGAKPTLGEMIERLTWEDLAAGGIITLEDIDAMLRAKGLDPDEYDHLYEQ